jgi:hypothetical protein
MTYRDKENDSLIAAASKDTIKQCPQNNFGLYDIIPANTASTVSSACDRFFESRNIKYGSSWFHERKERKKEIQQAQNERNTDN